jgi:hypothetical protein
MAKNTTIASEVEDKQTPQVEYSDIELNQRSVIIEEARHAADQKRQKYIDLDDMDYESWYYKAKKNAQAYIKPKENEEDVQVVTGTTREKGNTIVSTLLSFNLECDIMAYDEDNNENRELGNAVEKLVRKSRELELPRYEVKRPMVYGELINQGNVFVIESWDEFSIPEKELEKMDWSEEVQLDKIKWKEKLGKLYSFCNSSILTGLEVFPGNIRQPFMELQPYFITRKVLTYSQTKAMFGSWERFKYVPKQLQTGTLTNELVSTVAYDDFQMIETETDLIEWIVYYNKWTNEYQIMLNGVLMLPVGFPMSALNGVCEYPISKGDGEMIGANFFFSRGIGAKTRMDQAMLDEFFKMMIIKTRKSYKPPIANKGNYNVGPSIYLPGKIFKNIDADKLQEIGTNNGVTVAEFNMTQFVKEVIDNKSITPVMEGQTPGKQATARQLIMQKEQSMTKLGGVMLGVINLEQRMAWLRIYNILSHWTDAIDSKVMTTRDGVKKMTDVYRTISVSDTIENGREGEKIIDLTEDVPPPSIVKAEEDVLSKVKGKPIRKVYINPKMLKNLKYSWQVTITPTEKNTDDLKAAMYEEFLQKVFTLFMPAGKMPNMDYLADRFAQVNDEDPDQVWQQQQAAQPIGMPTQAEQPQGQIPAQMAQQGAQKPSLNSVLNG